MEISKAIEILEDLKNTRIWSHEPDKLDALNLGISALKRHRVALTGFAKPKLFLLPGETLKEGLIPLQKLKEIYEPK